MTSRVHLLYTVSFLIAAGCGFGAIAQTAETDADFSRYCRETYPGSAPTTRAVGGQMNHYCNLGGSLQGVDLARACELTTGNRSYRLIGSRVICGAGDGPTDVRADEPLKAGDYVRYCRERFAGSTYQSVAMSDGPRPHCRRPGATGGFTVQPVDLRDACETLRGNGDYRREAGRVYCGEGGQSIAAAGGAGASNGSSEPSSKETQSDGPDQNAGSDDGTKGAGASGPDSLSGSWTVRVGTLPGATIRIVRKGDKVTGVLADIPAAIESYFRTWTALEIGDVVFVGRVDGDRLTGRSVLGITGQRNPGTHPTTCGTTKTQYRSDPSRWPALEATVSAKEIDGRYRGINLYYRDGRCGEYPFTDYPPLVRGGWVNFDLARLK